MKQRLVGAVVLVVAAVILLPVVLEMPSRPEPAVPPSPRPEPRAAPPAPSPAPQVQPPGPGVPGTAARVLPLEEVTPVPEPAPRSPSPPPVEPAPRPPPSAPPAPSVAPSVAPPAPSVAPSVAPAPPAPPPSAARAAGWVVQMGSFAQEGNALALRDRLRKEGHPAFVETRDSERGPMTRVLVGPMPSREEATARIAPLESATRLRGFVVRYEGSPG